MKSFRKFVEESKKYKPTSTELNDLRKEVNKIKPSNISRSTNSGFYVEVDCKKENNSYEVTDATVTALNGITSSWNGNHKHGIDWEMPDSTKSQVYISFK